MKRRETKFGPVGAQIMIIDTNDIPYPTFGKPKDLPMSVTVTIQENDLDTFRDIVVEMAKYHGWDVRPTGYRGKMNVYCPMGIKADTRIERLFREIPPDPNDPFTFDRRTLMILGTYYNWKNSY